MTFTQTPFEKSLERMMTGIPNFNRRGYGVMIINKFELTAKMCDCRLCHHYQKKKGCAAQRCPCIADRIIAGAASLREVLTETMSDVSDRTFRKRLNQYINESEGYPMTFKNEKHRTMFNNAVSKMNHKNYALMAAVYLLTAECRLWNTVKHKIEGNTIRFDKLKLHDSSEDDYTLFCAAKDLYIGTKHLTVSDLADTDLISPRMFGLICNAMTIRRFGLGAINYSQTGGM